MTHRKASRAVDISYVDNTEICTLEKSCTEQ